MGRDRTTASRYSANFVFIHAYNKEHSVYMSKEVSQSGTFTFKGLKERYGTRLLSCGEEWSPFLADCDRLGVVRGSKDRVVGEVYALPDGYAVVLTSYTDIGVRLDPRWLDSSLSTEEQWARVFMRLHVVVG